MNVSTDVEQTEGSIFSSVQNHADDMVQLVISNEVAFLFCNQLATLRKIAKDYERPDKNPYSGFSGFNALDFVIIKF